MRKWEEKCAIDGRTKRGKPGEVKSEGSGRARIRVHNAVYGRHIHQDNRKREGGAKDMWHELGVQHQEGGIFDGCKKSDSIN